MCDHMVVRSLSSVGLPKNHVDDGTEVAPRLWIRECPLLSCYAAMLLGIHRRFADREILGG